MAMLNNQMVVQELGLRWVYHPSMAVWIGKLFFFTSARNGNPIFRQTPTKRWRPIHIKHLQLQWFQICGIIMYHHLPLNRGFLDVSGCLRPCKTGDHNPNVSLRLHRICAAAATSCHRTATQWMCGSRGPASFPMIEEVGPRNFTVFMKHWWWMMTINFQFLSICVFTTHFRWFIAGLPRYRIIEYIYIIYIYNIYIYIYI